MTPFLQLTLAIAIIILAAKAGGYIAVRLRQPAVLGELLVGLILGPTFVDLVHLPFVSDPELLQEEINDLAALGVVFLMFMAGLEVELDEMLRSGRASLLSGTLGVVVPLFMGAVAALPFGYHRSSRVVHRHHSDCDQRQHLRADAAGIGRAANARRNHAAGRGRRRRRAGVDRAVDLSGAGRLGQRRRIGYRGRCEDAGVSGLSAALGWFVLPRVVTWVDRQPISEGLTAVVLFITLVFAWSAEVMGGLAAITGAFIAGVGLGRSPLRDKIESKMRIITYGFLVPIFFVSIGLEANLREITGALLPFLIVLFVVAVLSKVIGAGLGARAGRVQQRRVAARGRGHDLARRGGPHRRRDRRAAGHHLAGSFYGGRGAGPADDAGDAAAAALRLSLPDRCARTCAIRPQPTKENQHAKLNRGDCHRYAGLP